MKRPDLLLYLLSLLVFGTNGIVAAAIALPSQEIILLRTLLGSLCLLTIFLLSRPKLLSRVYPRELGFLILSGVAQGFCFLLIFKAYQLVGVSLASLAYYTGPVLVMIAAPLLFQEKLTRGVILGFLTVLAGILLVNGQAVVDGKDPMGILCGLLAAVMYAVLVSATKKAPHITGLENPTIQLLASLVTVAAYVGLTQGFAIQVPPGDWPPILVIGLVNTGLACYLYYSSIGSLPARTVAITGYLEPLSAVLYSALLLGERLAALQWLGAALIVAGALFGELAGRNEKGTVP